MKELSIEEKAQRYDETIEKLRDFYRDYDTVSRLIDVKEELANLIPELKESEDERIRKKLIKETKGCEVRLFETVTNDEFVAWLEKQGEPKSYWKPSKDEMDALYGLAYITNTMDDKKDEAVTKLYQDLKKEFFNGASYENMFPSSPVDAPIKDEKQGEQKTSEWRQDNVEELTEFENVMMHIGSSFFGENAGLNPNDTTCIKEQANLLLELVPKQEWSEEDKNMLQSILDEYKSMPTEKRNWLKSLKDRVQPKQEWSALDERNLQGVIDEIKANKNNAPDYDLETYDRFLNWLKSLRPHNTWKPSDEQMKALKSSTYCQDKKMSKVLFGLYQDLKKLREE